LQDGLSDELDTTKSVTSDKLKEVTALIEALETNASKASTTTRKKLKSDLTEIEKASNRNRIAALNSLKWGWLKYSLPALLVLVTILGASWGAMHLMSQELMETRQEILSAQQTLEKLPAAVQFLEQSGDQYLLLETEPDLYQAKSGSWVIKLNKP
jgi:hypothetical protein